MTGNINSRFTLHHVFCLHDFVSKHFNEANDLEVRVDCRMSDEASTILNEYNYSHVNMDN